MQCSASCVGTRHKSCLVFVGDQALHHSGRNFIVIGEVCLLQVACHVKRLLLLRQPSKVISHGALWHVHILFHHPWVGTLPQIHYLWAGSKLADHVGKQAHQWTMCVCTVFRTLQVYVHRCTICRHTANSSAMMLAPAVTSVSALHCPGTAERQQGGIVEGQLREIARMFAPTKLVSQHCKWPLQLRRGVKMAQKAKC